MSRPPLKLATISLLIKILISQYPFLEAQFSRPCSQDPFLNASSQVLLFKAHSAKPISQGPFFQHAPQTRNHKLVYLSKFSYLKIHLSRSNYQGPIFKAQFSKPIFQGPVLVAHYSKPISQGPFVELASQDFNFSMSILICLERLIKVCLPNFD